MNQNEDMIEKDTDKIVRITLKYIHNQNIVSSLPAFYCHLLPFIDFYILIVCVDGVKANIANSMYPSLCTFLFCKTILLFYICGAFEN